MIRFFLKGVCCFCHEVGEIEEKFRAFLQHSCKKNKNRSIQFPLQASAPNVSVYLRKYKLKSALRRREWGGLFVVGVDVFGQVADATLSL